MTLYVDPRRGSGDLLTPLKRLSLPAVPKRMKFGDFAFRGQGPSGEVRVGIEYKKLSDLTSCIIDKRLTGHQLPGLMRRYQYRYLLINATIRPSSTSGLECFSLFRSRRGSELGAFSLTRSPITYPALQKYLFTLENLAGVRIRFVSCRADAIGYIAALYHWWQKPWATHGSHLALPAWEDGTPGPEIEWLFRKHSKFRRMASSIPGIGFSRSISVVKKFRCPERAIRASETAWANLTTTDRNGKKRRLGLKTAKVIKKFFRTKVKW